MPVRWVVGAALLLGLVGPARAQQADRFFADKVEVVKEGQKGKKKKRRQVTQGSLTSTSFVYREVAPIAPALSGGVEGVENASRITRVFTDMRAQVDGRSLSDGPWDARADARVRVTTDGTFQSGAYGGREYDVRELYVRRVGEGTDWTAGRQFVLELAATKVDGLRFDARRGQWTYLGFAGAYPNRASRSVVDDYPKAVDAMGMETTTRIIPVAGGLGAAYRFQKAYGAIGAVGILPRAEENLPGGPRQEKPRVFATANGYWRQSPQLDLFHFVVFDIEGSAAKKLTNLTAGANYRPTKALRLSASVNRVDTETLNVIAQTRLEDPGPSPNAVVQNNIEVSRISQESARVGISAAFAEQRFELSTSGLLRRRPEIQVKQSNFDPANPDENLVIIPAAQAAEITLQAVDRRSLKGHRIGASFTSIFGRGGTNLYRTDANVFRVDAAKEFKGGLGEYQLDLSYILSKDETGGNVCGLDPLTCFGTSSINTLSLGGTVFYRFKLDWFVIAGASVGSQGITISDPTDGAVPQKRILLTSAFLRAAYRF